MSENKALFQAAKEIGVARQTLLKWVLERKAFAHRLVIGGRNHFIFSDDEIARIKSLIPKKHRRGAAPLLALILLLFTGCEHFNRITGKSASAERTGNIYLAMGQSQLVHFFPAGEAAFKADMPEGTVLIGCAMGATRLSDWQVDQPNVINCVERLAEYKKVYGGELAGILFAQGEQDAYPGPGGVRHVEDYAVALQDTFRDYRRVFGNPSLKIVFAQLATTNGGEYQTADWPKIKEQQASVRQAHTAMIKTEDLPLGDHVHYLYPSSYIQLADRYAQVFLSHSFN